MSYTRFDEFGDKTTTAIYVNAVDPVHEGFIISNKALRTRKVRKRWKGGRSMPKWRVLMGATAD